MTPALCERCGSDYDVSFRPNNARYHYLCGKCEPRPGCSHPLHRRGSRGGLSPNQEVCMQCGATVLKRRGG